MKRTGIGTALLTALLLLAPALPVAAADLTFASQAGNDVTAQGKGALGQWSRPRLTAERRTSRKGLCPWTLCSRFWSGVSLLRSS